MIRTLVEFLFIFSGFFRIFNATIPGTNKGTMLIWQRAPGIALIVML